MELENPHLSILVGGVETQTGLVPHPHVVEKFRRDISGARSPHTTPALPPPSPGFQGQEDKSPQLQAAKTSGD